MSVRRYAKAGVLAAIVALSATGCAAETDQPLDAEKTSEASQAISAPRIVLDHVDVVVGGAGDPFSGINPCVKVRRGLYFVSQATENKGIQFDFTYTSNGEVVTESAIVPIDSMTFMGKDPDDKRYFMLDSFIDVDNPVDVGSSIETEITLIKNLASCA